MGKIKKLLENELVGGTQTTDVYPVTSTKAVYDENNERLDNIINKIEPGIIYDVSANNDGAVFESLQALLSSSSLNTLIPTSVRYGGMSIRFIQGSVPNSDNKYLQYRLMADTFSTTVTDWQGVDDTISDDSDNLITSGGVKNAFNDVELKLGFPVDVNVSTLQKHKLSLTSNKIWYQEIRNCHSVIPINNVTKVVIKPSIDAYYAFFTEDYIPPTDISSPIPFVPNTDVMVATQNVSSEINVPEGAAFLYLVRVDGGNNDVNWDVTLINSNSLKDGFDNDILLLKNCDISKSEIVVSDGTLVIDNSTKTFNLKNLAYKKNGGSSVITNPMTSLAFGTLSGNLSYACVVLDTNTNTFSVKEFVDTSIINTDVIVLVFKASFDTKVDNRYPYTVRWVSYCMLNYELRNGDVVIDRKVKYEDITDINNNISNLNTNIDIIEKSVKPVVTYEITNAEEHNYIPNMYTSNPTWYDVGKHIVIPCEPNDIFSLEAPNIAYNYIWLTNAYTPPTTSGGAVPSVNDMGRLTIDANAKIIVTAPTEAAYLCVVTVNGDEEITNAKITSVGKELDKIQKGIYGLNGDIHEYSGEKISLASKYGLLKVDGVTKFYNNLYPQGMAIYGGYMFRIYNTGECEIYNISSGTPQFVIAFTLACSPDSPHCNAAQFAPSVISGNFPYLYVCACKDSLRKCYVVSVDTDGTSSLIQTIIFPVLDGLPDAMPFNAIIGDDGYLYCCGFKGTKMYFSKFKCPNINVPEVTLMSADLVFSWTDDYYDNTNCVFQGMCVNGGRLYLAYGGTYYERGVFVYDVFSGIKVSNVKMTGIINAEFEDIAIYNNKLYLEVVDTCYYELTFN